MTDRVDISLHAIAAYVEDLPELVEDWPEMGEGEKASLEMEWSELASRTRLMEERLVAGELTAEQEERYRAIKARLRENMPHLEALRLDPPKVPLD